MFLVLLFASVLSHASTLQCPNLRGTFFCPGVEGSHEDMFMTIKQRDSYNSDQKQVIEYTYLYRQVNKKPFSLVYFGNDEGTVNPNPAGKNKVGRCWEGYFYNSLDGTLDNNSYLNGIDRDKNYVVIIHKDDSLFLKCTRKH